MSALEAALALAQAGVPVFPCLENKSPACAHGFKDATTDAATIRALFAQSAAVLVGVPTGQVSGWDVLDLDPRHGSDDWLRGHGATIPSTRTHGTRSGGRHIVFRHRPGLSCSTGGKGIGHRPGVDIRADGGYVIHWPSAGVPILSNAEVTEWPDALLAEITRKDPAVKAAERDTSASPPPSAGDVIDLLERLPNPLSVDRDTYARVMLAAAGCVRSLGDDPGGLIEDAAVAWAERWEGGSASDERQKWADDWTTRPDVKAGWDTLRGIAGKLNPGYHHPSQGAEFDALPPLPAPVRAGLLGRLMFPADCVTSASRGYLIKHLLAPGDVAALIGPPSAGKSVLAPHIAYAMAQGRPVFGLRTKPGRVLYAAAEDGAGMRQRIRALYNQHGDAPDFALVEITNLRDKAAAADLEATVVEWKPALLVIDTLGAAWAGLDENSSVDMGDVVALARRIAGGGCAVLLIHHIAKAGDGSPRGHSALNGTLDMCLALGDRAADGTIRAKLQKNRNGTPDREIAFRIAVAELGQDEDGDTITAPVAAEVTADRPAAPKLSRQQAIAWAEFLKIEAETAPDASGTRSVSLTKWKDFCGLAALSSSSNQDSQRTTFNRAAGDLYRMNYISKSTDYAWRGVQGVRYETSETDRDSDKTVSGHHRDRRDTHPRGVCRVSVPGSEFIN